MRSHWYWYSFLLGNGGKCKRKCISFQTFSVSNSSRDGNKTKGLKFQKVCNVQPSLSSPIVVSSTKPLHNTFLGMVELTDSRKDVDLYFSIYSIFTLWLPVQCSDISIRLVLHYLDIFNRTSPTQTVCVVNLVFGRWRLYFTSSKDRSLFYWKLFYIFWRQIFVLLTVFYIF